MLSSLSSSSLSLHQYTDTNDDDNQDHFISIKRDINDFFEEKFRNKYEILKDLYEERLRHLMTLFRNVENIVNNDPVIDAMKNDKITAPFVPPRIEEIFLQEFASDREFEIKRLMELLADQSIKINELEDQLEMNNFVDSKQKNTTETKEIDFRKRIVDFLNNIAAFTAELSFKTLSVDSTYPVFIQRIDDLERVIHDCTQKSKTFSKEILEYQSAIQKLHAGLTKANNRSILLNQNLKDTARDLEKSEASRLELRDQYLLIGQKLEHIIATGDQQLRAETEGLRAQIHQAELQYIEQKNVTAQLEREMETIKIQLQQRDDKIREMEFKYLHLHDETTELDASVASRNSLNESVRHFETKITALKQEIYELEKMKDQRQLSTMESNEQQPTNHNGVAGVAHDSERITRLEDIIRDLTEACGELSHHHTDPVSKTPVKAPMDPSHDIEEHSWALKTNDLESRNQELENNLAQTLSNMQRLQQITLETRAALKRAEDRNAELARAFGRLSEVQGADLRAVRGDSIEPRKAIVEEIPSITTRVDAAEMRTHQDVKEQLVVAEESTDTAIEKAIAAKNKEIAELRTDHVIQVMNLKSKLEHVEKQRSQTMDHALSKVIGNQDSNEIAILHQHHQLEMDAALSRANDNKSDEIALLRQQHRKEIDIAISQVIEKKNDEIALLRQQHQVELDRTMSKLLDSKNDELELHRKQNENTTDIASSEAIAIKNAEIGLLRKQNEEATGIALSKAISDKNEEIELLRKQHEEAIDRALSKVIDNKNEEMEILRKQHVEDIDTALSKVIASKNEEMEILRKQHEEDIDTALSKAIASKNEEMEILRKQHEGDIDTALSKVIASKNEEMELLHKQHQEDIDIALSKLLARKNEEMELLRQQHRAEFTSAVEKLQHLERQHQDAIQSAIAQVVDQKNTEIDAMRQKHESTVQTLSTSVETMASEKRQVERRLLDLDTEMERFAFERTEARNRYAQREQDLVDQLSAAKLRSDDHASRIISEERTRHQTNLRGLQAQLNTFKNMKHSIANELKISFHSLAEELSNAGKMIKKHILIDQARHVRQIQKVQFEAEQELESKLVKQSQDLQDLANTRAAALQTEIHHLQSQLNTNIRLLAEEKQTSEANDELWRQTNNSLRHTVDTLQTKLANYEQSAKRNGITIVSLENKIASASQEIVDLEQKLDGRTSQLMNFLDGLVERFPIEQSVLNRIVDTRILSTRSIAHIWEVVDEDLHRAKVDAIENEASTWKQSFSQLEEGQVALETENGRIHKENSSLRTQIDSLSLEVNAKTQEIERLKEAFDNAQRRHREDMSEEKMYHTEELANMNEDYHQKLAKLRNDMQKNEEKWSESHSDLQDQLSATKSQLKETGIRMQERETDLKEQLRQTASKLKDAEEQIESSNQEWTQMQSELVDQLSATKHELQESRIKSYEQQEKWEEDHTELVDQLNAKIDELRDSHAVELQKVNNEKSLIEGRMNTLVDREKMRVRQLRDQLLYMQPTSDATLLQSTFSNRSKASASPDTKREFQRLMAKSQILDADTKLLGVSHSTHHPNLDALRREDLI